MLFIRHYSSLCVLELTKYAKLGDRNLSVSIAPVLGLQGRAIMPSPFPWTLGIMLLWSALDWLSVSPAKEDQSTCMNISQDVWQIRFPCNWYPS